MASDPDGTQQWLEDLAQGDADRQIVLRALVSGLKFGGRQTSKVEFPTRRRRGRMFQRWLFALKYGPIATDLILALVRGASASSRNHSAILSQHGHEKCNPRFSLESGLPAFRSISLIHRRRFLTSSKLHASRTSLFSCRGSAASSALLPQASTTKASCSRTYLSVFSTIYTSQIYHGDSP
jgi:hypothetical protein